MSELKRSLGYGTIIAISITSMVGTGMFVGVAFAAQEHNAGNMSIFSWAFMGVMSIYIAYCFGELVGMFPNSGGVYEFAKVTYGRFIAFMTGWITWLVGNITTSVVIVTALKFMITDNFVMPFFPNMSTELAQVSVAILIIIALNYIAYKGIDASAKVLMFFATITIAVIVTLIFAGFRNIDASNLTPLFANVGMFDGTLLVLMSAFFIMETFFGWESATFLAEETKNADTIIPRSIVITSIIVAILAILSAVVMLGNIPWETIPQTEGGNIAEPLFMLSSLLFPASLWLYIKTGVFIVLIGSAAGGIVSTPRLLLALARDKLFINSLSQVHEKFKTPYKAIIFQAVVTIMIVVVGVAEYDKLLQMLLPLAILMYISVLLAVTILRFRMPDAKRTMKVPFGKIGPVIVSALFFIILYSQIGNPETWVAFKQALSFVFFGIPIYMLLMFYYDPDVIIKLNDIFAYFTLAFERVLIPKRIDRDIFNHLGDIEDKTILEFGSGVGTFTKELAKEVGPRGSVYATDVSYTQVKIASKRISKLGLTNVKFIHDIHQVNRVHHSIPQVDCIVSIGMLGYLQDINKVLGEMHRILPEGGRIFFMDYVDLFKVIPNVSWLSNKDELKGLFKNCGFAVKVEKLNGNFWNYLFIYGIKTEQDVPYI